MTRTALSFSHRFVPATVPERQPLLLLHGTGGDENDLVPLGEMVAPGAALLSPRGKVLENGMPRFFRRLAEGVFDEGDLRNRAQELAEFVEQAKAAYELPAPMALGFSNGANMAAALLLLQPGTLAGAVLLRATLPLSDPPAGSLKGSPVLVLSGRADPLVRADDAVRLATVLGRAGAAVRHETVAAGHQLSQADIALTTGFLAQV